MKLFKRIFNKRSKQPKRIPTIQDNMAYMALIGVPMVSIVKYEDACNKIKEFENRLLNN